MSIVQNVQILWFDHQAKALVGLATVIAVTAGGAGYALSSGSGDQRAVAVSSVEQVPGTATAAPSPAAPQVTAAPAAAPLPAASLPAALAPATVPDEPLPDAPVLVEDAPVAQAPVQQAPVQQAPAQSAPVRQAPVVEAPAAAPAALAVTGSVGAYIAVPDLGEPVTPACQGWEPDVQVLDGAKAVVALATVGTGRLSGVEKDSYATSWSCDWDYTVQLDASPVVTFHVEYENSEYDRSDDHTMSRASLASGKGPRLYVSECLACSKRP